MLAKTYVERLNEACRYVKDRIRDRPDIGIILGSGLGHYGDELTNAIRIPFKEIPGFFDTTVPGHSGCLIFGNVGARKVLCLSGRSHQYEGLYPHEVQFAIRVLAICGCRLCILTNAAGTRDPELDVGDLSPIGCHLNMTHLGYTEEPLIQRDFDHLLQQDLYDQDATQTATRIASAMGLQTKKCVYTYDFGPTYETPNEVETVWALGGSNLGMSTVPEIIAMKELRVPVFALSFATNKAAGISATPLSHAEVQAAATAAEPVLRKLISTLIEETPIKDFPIPELTGDDHLITRVQPNFVHEFGNVAALFGATKIDTAVVLGACHTLANFEAKTIIQAADLPDFPILDQPKLSVKLGALGGRSIAVVDGLRNLTGCDPFQLHYLINLFATLGAKTYVQTFTTGYFDSAGVKTAKDLIPFFERNVKCPNVAPAILDSGLAGGFPTSVLGSYHGPEFPNESESLAISRLGATQFTLGTIKGLLIAKALGLNSVAITDGSFKGVIPGDVTLNAILDASRSSSPGVSAAVSNAVNNTPHSAQIASSFTPSGAKALEWNKTPPRPVNAQEDPEAVSAASAALPDVQFAFLFPSEIPTFEGLRARLQTVTKVGTDSVYSGELFGKRIAAAVPSRTLVRALAQRGIVGIAVSPVVATGDVPTGEKYVAFRDHTNLSGPVPLVGRNRFGDRFPDCSKLYLPIPWLRGIAAFNVVDIREATPAYLAGMRNAKCDAATEFGPVEAVLARHSGGKFKAIGVIVKSPGDEWSVEDSVLASAVE